MHVKFGVAIVVMALLSGCQRVGEAQDDPSQSGTAYDPASASAGGDSFGLWQLSAITPNPPGTDLAKHVPVYMTIGTQHLAVQSQCVAMRFGIISNSDGRTQFGTPASLGEKRGDGVATCARGLTPVEVAVQNGLREATRRELQPDGSLRIAGPRASFRLARVHGAVANPFGNSPPPAVLPVWGSWRVTQIGSTPVSPMEPMELAITGGVLEMRSGCVGRWHKIAQQDATLSLSPLTGLPVCQRGLTAFETAYEAAMTGEMAVQPGGDGSIQLQGAGDTIMLAPQ